MSMPRKAEAAAYIRRLAVSRVREGISAAEVARFLGVTARSVQRWVKRAGKRGLNGLADRPHPGRPAKLTADQQAGVLSWLDQKPEQFGFVAQRWTAPRVTGLIRDRYGIGMNHRYVSDWLRRRRITPQVPETPAAERDEVLIEAWVRRLWPWILKTAAKTDATVVFSDESGLLMSPLMRRTLAPAGRTPVIEVPAKHRQKVSVVAALFRSPRTGRCRLVHETLIDRYADDFLYAEFLRERVVRGSRRPLILIQDNAPFHLGQWTTELIEDSYPRLDVFQLPPYAPELNPVEQLWTWTKYHELANFVPTDLGQLAAATDHVVGTAERDPNRLNSFFEGAALRW